MNAVLSLDALGLESGTDKGSWGHNYLSFYEPYFRPLRREKLKFLEIGVAGGASLRVWEKYFLEAEIIGADINPGAAKFARDRIKIEILDQARVEDLVSLGSKHGPFDIIIEDGSHMWGHQISTLKALLPFLNPNGMYIVEDLQTNFGSLMVGYRGTCEVSCVEYLKRLIDIRVGDRQFDLSKEPDPFLREYGRKIGSISFYKGVCLIQNGPVEVTDETLLRDVEKLAEEMRDSLSLLAHIGGYGDRSSDKSVILGRSGGQNIQGFSIRSGELLEGDIEYRARCRSGIWTGWASGGAFLGTRGRGEDLTGFSVRLVGACSEIYALVVIGRFSGTEYDVVVQAGEECVGEGKDSPLCGMQITVCRR